MQPTPRLTSALLLITIACATNESPPARTARRDSGGASLVSNSAPRWKPGDEWRVVEPPTLDIGTTGGDPQSQFNTVLNAFRLSDGRIAVHDLGSNQFRIFDAKGKFLVAAGRHGRGPGEFGQLFKSAVLGDTL